MFITAVFEKLFEVKFVAEMMLNSVINTVREKLQVVPLVLLARFRLMFLDNIKEPTINGVYICSIDNPEDTGMQDLATSTFFGMEDVTRNYMQRLTFTDPKTVLKQIPFEEVWRILTKGVEGYNANIPGRMEVRYTDRFGSEKCAVFRSGRDVTLPLTNTKTSFLSPTLIDCRLKVRRKYIDDSGDEVSMCDEEDDAEDIGSVLHLVKPWVSNIKDVEDPLLCTLAMRDVLIEHSELIRFMMKETAYPISKYDVELETTFSNLESRGKGFEFTWDNGVWLNGP